MSVEELIEAVKRLPPEDRRKLLNAFCRSCGVFLERLDWADRNYCDCCSPDPRED